VTLWIVAAGPKDACASVSQRFLQAVMRLRDWVVLPAIAPRGGA